LKSDTQNTTLELQLIRGCTANDRKSQEKLYFHYFDKMYAVCAKYAKDESEAISILNDGFLKVFKNIQHFRNEGSLEGWIRKTIYHSVADHFRLKLNNVNFLLPEENEGHFIKNEEATQNLFFEDIVKLIDKLPAASARVLLLYAVEGYNHKEIGEMLEISESTSKWHLANARQILRDKLFKIYHITPKISGT
jgi:RNA polymerase sigma-70 factor (ECF subfamily)